MAKLIRAIFVLLLVASTAHTAEKCWQAGVAKVNITPELPIWLSGYASRDKPAATKHDDLWAKALVIEDATGHRAVLVTMDLVGIDRELSMTVCHRLKERFNFARPDIVLSTSHTHSGPVLRGNLMPMFALDADQSRRVTDYKQHLMSRLVDVVGEAVNTLQPAKLNWGIGDAGFAVNRRNNPEAQVARLREEGNLKGPVDHELPVFTIRGDDNTLRAIVGGYACHATVLADFFISADWPGAAQNELERRHPGAIAMFVAGCGGDQNPLPRRSIALMEKYGAEFADGADAAITSKLEPLAPQLTTAYAEIDLPFDTLPTRGELVADAASGKKPAAPWARYLLGEWDRTGSLPATYPYPLQAWKLGDDLTWIFLGGECVVDFSLRLKAELGPGKTWVSAYTNDVMAYIPSRRVLAEGGYEGGLARFPYGLPAPWGNRVEELVVGKAHELAKEAGANR